MATIIRAADSPHGSRAAALNFDDLASQAGQYLEEVKAQAARVIADAEQQADAIRESAAKEGAQAAIQAVEKMVAEQMAPSIAALNDASDSVRHVQEAWLSHWEANVVRLAVAIAAKIIRREVRTTVDITLDLVREALELAAGSPGIRLHMHPEDYQLLGQQVQAIVQGMASLGDAELVPDAEISRGGCRVETRFGSIDQQFESQLKRIEEELTA